MKRSKIALLMIFSAFVGIFGWSCDERWTSIIAMLPILWSKAETRSEGFLIMLTYYLTASRGMIPGAYIFFQDGSFSRALLLWIASSAVLSLPWLIKIQDNDGMTAIFAKIACVTLASVPPPLGIIGWANPLLVAGVFFSVWGLYGFVAMIFVWVCCVRFRLIQNLSVIIVLLTVLFPISLEPKQHPDFIGVNTSFGQLASGSANLDFLSEYKRIRMVFSDLEERKELGELLTKNIVLPETICGLLFTDTAKNEWERGALKILGEDWKEKGRSLFIGAEIIPNPNSKKYDNVMISFGADTIYYRQKIPVPFSMFRPFSDSGANAYLFEAESVQLADGTKAGFIICYEQLVSWSWLLMLIGNNWQSPDVIICPANNWWCEDTSLPTIQARNRELWARVIGCAVVVAGNDNPH